MMPCNHNYVNIVYGKLPTYKILELRELGVIYGGIKEKDSPTHICTICLEVYPEIKEEYE